MFKSLFFYIIISIIMFSRSWRSQVQVIANSNIRLQSKLSLSENSRNFIHTPNKCFISNANQNLKDSNNFPKRSYSTNSLNIGTPQLLKRSIDSLKYYVSRISPSCEVILIPIFEDNYSYILVDKGYKSCAVVDPADPDKTLKIIQHENIIPKFLLCTHKHWDHSAGNSKLSSEIPDLKVVTTAYEDIPSADIQLFHNESIELDNFNIKLFHTPCHTKGHAVFYITSNNPGILESPILFSGKGDTLFISGCGRFFEGSAKDMSHSLDTLIANLPKETLIYCGHEYTNINLRFALSVEPQNPYVKTKLELLKECFKNKEPSVPSTINDELLFNPFMRSSSPDIRKLLKINPSAKNFEVIQKLRDLRNSFK